MSLRQRSFGCHTRNYLAAMAAVDPEILVGGQAIHGSDEIGDGLEGRHASPLAASALEPFANYIGLRDLAPARFRLDVGHQRLGQSHGESLHGLSVLHIRQLCKTSAEPASLLTT